MASKMLTHRLPTSIRTVRPVTRTILRSYSFKSQPSPHRLPPDQQAEFERLQRSAMERLETPPPPSSTAPPTSANPSTQTTATSATTQEPPEQGGVWRGPPPEFQGDTNPKTGEVGGPKNEPLRWGSGGDWSYRGRVTDF